MRGALLRYRVLAYVVGVLLVLLVCVGVPLRYLAGVPEVSRTVSPVHGLVFVVYLVALADLARHAGWGVKRVRAARPGRRRAVPVLRRRARRDP